MTTIKYATDKNGKQIAYEWHNSAMRWVRISLERAYLLIQIQGDQVEIWQGDEAQVSA
jgi:hypothetical protein